MARPRATVQAGRATKRAGGKTRAIPQCRGRPPSASTQHGRCDRPDSRRIRRGRGRRRGREEIIEKRLRLDAAAGEKSQTQFHLPVARPACPHGLPLLRQAVAAQRTQPGDPARGTIFVPSLLVISSASVARCLFGMRGAPAMAVSTRRCLRSCRLTLGSGEGVFRHGDAVLSRPRDFLLKRETGAMSPALLGRLATASAMLAGVTFRRAGGRGRTRQRDPRASQDLLHDEQPDKGPSQASFADRRHICQLVQERFAERQVSERTDYFTSGSGSQRLPGLEVNAIADELNVSVAE
jgi:hypothetical protein